MFERWHQRHFTMEEAAGLAGMPVGSLRVLVARTPAELYSVKRANLRWFSAKDCAVIRTAQELWRGGMVQLVAIATAYNLLDYTLPDRDDFLVVRVGTTSHTDGRYATREEVQALPFDTSTQIVPIGAITHGVAEAAQKLEGKASI
jgi:hypothetical protein